ncbi:D-alanine--D-alanine ligase, partial [Streptococcus anginosus]|nr:D-alanine--D-alanine ligase [Streptococcus anginosus]
YVPARLSDEEKARVTEAALTAHTTLRLRDVSRIDLIVKEGTPYVIDVNIAPGMTETSLLPQAVEAYARENGTSPES